MKVYAPPAEVPVPSMVNEEGRFDYLDYERREDEFLAALAAWVRLNGQPHALAGEVVRVPYADGYAQYMVAKFDNKVCLIHLPLGDAWQDDRFERLATVAELRRMVEASRRLASIFAGRK